MDRTISDHRSWIRDAISVLVFVICVIVGTVLVNTFIFRSFSVVGQSMETTLYTGDRLIINRIPVTAASIQGKKYIPNRGQIIVFKNPQYTASSGEDEYLVKRVIAFGGERVVLKNGKYTVYNNSQPNGFNPDSYTIDQTIGSPTSGSIDEVVPQGEIFVSGDHRQANYSYDSRNGLGTIPIENIVGPVSARIFPFNKIRFF